MRNAQDRQRVTECGCHYDAPTGRITMWCDDLGKCVNKEERLAVIKYTQSTPSIGHIIGVKYG